MTSADDPYVRYAEQCRKQAGSCTLPREREFWLAMAEEWQRLADMPSSSTRPIEARRSRPHTTK